MGPKRLDLTAYTDSGLYEVVGVVGLDNSLQDMTGWLVHGSAVNGLDAAAEAIPVTAAVVSAGRISISIAPADAAALFPTGDTSNQKFLDWTLLARPYGTFTVKLFYGSLRVKRGAGRWA